MKKKEEKTSRKSLGAFVSPYYFLMQNQENEEKKTREQDSRQKDRGKKKKRGEKGPEVDFRNEVAKSVSNRESNWD